MTFALIPAGGKSTRMGRPKLALPLGGKSILEHVVATLKRAGVEDVLVVVSPLVPDLQALAKAAGALVHSLPHETPDMRATVEAGLRCLEERFEPRNDDNWLLVPADHPTLHEGVVRLLIEARASHPERSIVVPTYDGRRGHPTLIAWKHVAGIRSCPAGEGINNYLRRHEEETLPLPVASDYVLDDLDTPEDYERILRYYSGAARGA